MRSTKKPAANIGMVALEAGVSPSTISRILNGSAIVSDAKRLAVETAIAKLGFVPNPIARGLAGGRTMSIGVITQAIDSPFYGVALRGIENALKPHGYSPLFISGQWDAVSESHCVDVLRSRRVDGMIVLTGRLSDSALKFCAKQIPVVVTGRHLKATGLYSLSFDNLHGAKLATDHLLKLGHQHIAFIGGNSDHPDIVQRFRGYQLALEAAGVALNPKLVVEGNYDEASGMKAVDALGATGQEFSAIFVANDQMAFGAAHGLKLRSKMVPHDVSIVGFDDLPASQFAWPPLTTVRQPAYEIGAIAANAMLQLIAGEEPQWQLPAPQLIVRESTAAHPATR
jgi:LacI family transcriptional regulator